MSSTKPQPSQSAKQLADLIGGVTGSFKGVNPLTTSKTGASPSAIEWQSESAKLSPELMGYADLKKSLESLNLQLHSTWSNYVSQSTFSELLKHSHLPPTSSSSQPTSLTSVIAKNQEEFSRIIELLESIQERMAKSQPYTVTISTLLPTPLKLKRSISVSISPSDDEWMATFYDANISAIGPTPAQAINGLKDVIYLKYSRLTDTSVRLSNPMRNQLVVLQDFIEE